MNDQPQDQKIEVMHESVAYGDTKLEYSAPAAPVGLHERLVLAWTSLVLSLPFPVLLIWLWSTLGSQPSPSIFQNNGVVIAVGLYMLLIFIAPLTSIASSILGLMAITRPKSRTRTIGYVSLGVTTLGLTLLGFFVSR